MAQTSSFQSGFGVHRISISVDEGSNHNTASVSMGSWRQNVSFAVEHADAQFLVFRFAHMNLPPGASLLIREGAAYANYKRDDSALYYTSDHANNHRKTFYTRPLRARRAVVEYTVPAATAEAFVDGSSHHHFGFLIDQYRFAALGLYRGDVKSNTTAKSHNGGSKKKSSASVDKCVTGEDESDRAACVKDNPPVFNKAEATARLLVHKPNGSIFCTGFLLGCEGHILTNNHCVTNANEANSTFIEFLAQGEECSDDCDTPMGCPGVIEVGSSEIVASSVADELDFTLLKPRLPDADRVKLTKKYGYLSLRASGATRNERIFIPQHPAGYGKRVALKHDSTYGNVETLTDIGCNRRPESLGYKLDTQGGSSGSPVIAFADKTVVGLHYCGGCLNSAIPSSKIVKTLKRLSVLPKCGSV